MKVLQFGEGNFLRAFVDYMFDVANEKGVTDAKITIVKPVKFGSIEALKAQNCEYTLLTRGRENGKTVENARVIRSVCDAIGAYEDFNALLALARDPELKIIVSNTTEAGIALSEDDRFDDCPPTSYPAKLTRLLFERYTHFAGDEDAGLYILPCELILNNSRELEKCVYQSAKNFNLPEKFIEWIKSSCHFCTTLVDRIVTGRDPAQSEKYGDPMLDVCEPFALWVIEERADIRNIIPFDKAGLPVVFCDDVTPYRERKVRILNGAHTSTVLAAYLAGKSIVRECMQDDVISDYMRKIVYEEIIPTLTLEKSELFSFAESVFERFNNPFIDHALLSISLNSVSKFTARLLPSFKDYYKIYGKIPRRITFSFAALAAFYLDSGKSNDSQSVIDWFEKNRDSETLLPDLCGNIDFWGEDLNKYEGFCNQVALDLNSIRQKGAYEAMKCI